VAQAAQSAANKATAQWQATANEAHAAIAQTGQEATRMQMESEAVNRAAAQQHAAAQAAQAAANEAAAQQQNASNAAHGEAIAQTGTQQEAMIRLQAELEAAKAAAAQQHAALEQQRLELAAAQQHCGMPVDQQQVAQTELAQRTTIQNAMGNLAKRARSTSDRENDCARFGLHGSDGQYYPGVPAYVDPLQESADMHDHLSTIDGGLSRAESTFGSVTL
jgi:hypothetical protein